MEFTEITKPNLRYLSKVFRYKTRTIALLYPKSSAVLSEIWQEAQLEFCSQFQYSGENDNIWDYYLIFICEFNADNMDTKDRLAIENDKFCCRKYLVFGKKEADYSTEMLIRDLFPHIEIRTNIQVLDPKHLISKVSNQLKEKLPLEFFTQTKDESELEDLLKNFLDDK